MKQSLMRRVISFVMAVVMVALMLPVAAISVNAADVGEDLLSNGFPTYNLLNVDDGIHNLGQGNRAIVNLGYLKDAYLAWCNAGSYTTYGHTYITDLNEYLKNEQFKAGADAHWNQRFSMLEMDLKAKFQMEKTSSESYSESHEMVSMSVYASRRQMVLDLSTTKQLEALWAADENGNFLALNPYFVDALLTADPADFFANWGTHLVTRYNAGGEAFVSYEGEDIKESNSSSFAWEANISGNFKSPFTTEVDIGVNAEGKNDSTENTGNGYRQTNSEVWGGNGDVNALLKGDSGALADWLNTLEANDNLEILTDASLKLLPIWELLYEDQYLDRRIELEQYFNENVDVEFASFYGDYVYSPTAVANYQGYTFIRTAEDLNNVRCDLAGKYILLNNIDLSDVTDWTPIGTSAQPFSGVLDGNGNTVSGLSVTSCTDGAAGLFGYNNGTIRDLCVSGNVDVDGSGSENSVAYVGGIAGYNMASGKLEGCRNQVAVNGQLVAESSGEDAPEDAEARTWLDDHAEDIANAKAVAATAVTAGEQVTIGTEALYTKFTGTLTDVEIYVKASADPAFIVLEDVTLTGFIKMSGDNSRPLCIISAGSGNTITAPAGTAAVSAVNADVFITGDAPLSIRGGDGKDATSVHTENRPFERTDGNTLSFPAGVGDDGGDGYAAVAAASVGVDLDGVLTLTGGNGGNGANGSASSVKVSNVITVTNVAHQADGGQGGQGATAICVADGTSVALYRGRVYLYGGNGGNGGNGHAGTSHKSGNMMQMMLFSWRGADGGDGGDGGAGAQDACASLQIYANASVTTVGGVYGNGGNGGGGGKGATGLSASDGGEVTYNVAKGGNGGNAGSGLAVGTAGKGGAGGTNSAAGKAGTAGTCVTYSTEVLADGVVTHYTNIKQYEVYEHAYTRLDALQKVITVGGGAKLLSIGSAVEQALAEELLGMVEASTCWLGLQRKSDAGVDFNVFQWADGSQLKKEGDRWVQIGENGEILCDAYTNWMSGEPYDSGLDVTEMYGQMLSDGTWHDMAGNGSSYLIVEKDTGHSTNTIYQNVVMVGGLCGYNIGTITEACNEDDISARGEAKGECSVSTYAGGITGYNDGKISLAWNTGAVTAIAIAVDATQYYADAYAANIGETAPLGVTENYRGESTPVTLAYSANGLTSISDDMQKCVAGLDPMASLLEAWKNSELEIKAVTDITYLRGSAFNRESVSLVMQNQPIGISTVSYNFYNEGISLVTLTVKTDDGETYRRYVPVAVVAEQPTALEISNDRSMHQTTFQVGELFNYDGLVMVLCFDNGNEKMIPSKAVSVSQPDMSRVGTQTVEVTYALENGRAVVCPYDIIVENVPEETTPEETETEPESETETETDAPVVLPTATVKGASVVLGQALGITYNAEVQNATSTPVMKFTVGGKVMAEVEGTYNATNGRYYFELKGINPQCIGDNILAEVYVDGVMIASKDNYSIKTYLVGQLSKSATTEALKTLIYNTLAYGAAAQTYTGYNTGDMINAGYEDKAVSYDMGAIDGSDQGFALNNTRTDVKISGVSVNFGDVNKIMVQYVGNATLYVNGVAVEPASYNADSGKYTYYTDGIYASKLGTVFTFTLKADGQVVSTLSFSVNAYAARQQGKTTANAKLAFALFNYGMAAKAYIG